MSVYIEQWKQGLYLEGRDAAHDYMRDNPDAGYTRLQAHIYNFLMSFEPELRKYQGLCEKLSHQAAKRAHSMAQNNK